MTNSTSKNTITTTTNFMRNILSKLLVGLLFVLGTVSVNAQITITVTGNTNTTPNLLATYPSLSAALTDLNAVTAMTGPVVLTCDAGTSETAPVKGFVLGSVTLNPVLSSTNTITINKTGGTVTINAGVGTANGPSATPDGILYLNGADYVTIDGLTFTDGNSASATVAMEFGVAFFKRTAGDGCNNNTIQNCTFNMQRINNASGTTPMLDGSWGIEVLNSTAAAATTSLTPTNGGTLATNGTNSANKFYTNTINGGNGGIGFGGYAATLGVGPAPTATTFLGDLANDVGGASSGTGNIILNFGGAAAATNPSAGIRANNQWSVNISYNTVNNNNGSGVNHVSTLRGIYAQAGTSANATINNNIVTIQSGATTSTVTAIENVIGSTAAANAVSINSNTIKVAYITATTGALNGILNSSTAATVSINLNDIQGVASTNLAGTGSMIMISGGSSGGTLNTNSNTISNVSRSTTTSGTFRGIVAVTPPTAWNCTGNTIDGLSFSNASSTGSIEAIYNLSSALVQNINSNIIRNLSTPTTGTITGIRLNTVTGTHQCNNNQIYNFTTTAGGVGGASFLGINSSNGIFTCSGNLIYSLNSTGSTGGSGGTIYGIQITGTTQTVNNNAIYDLSSTSTNPLIAGINITGGTTNNVNNNLIGDLRAINSTGNVTISGIAVSGGTTNNIFHNTVNIASTTTSATTFGTSAIYFSSSTPVNNVRNNIFVNTSTPGPTGGFTAAIRYTIAPTSTNFPAANNNNFYYGGVAAANRLIYGEGSGAAATNGQQTIAAYKTYISTTLPVPGRESASVSEIPNWVSTTGSNPITTFLQYNTGVGTQIEQGGGLGTGISTDFAGTTRCPGGGCPGATATPDMGAWELNGISADFTPPSISYTPLPFTCLTTDRTLSGVTIADASGVPIEGSGTEPRIYYKKNAGAYFSRPGTKTSGTYTNGVWSFPIVVADMGGVAGGDVVSYFVIAQDLATPINIASNPSAGLVATNVNTVTTPPTTPNTYSVSGNLSGSYNVGAGQTYTTLTAAINSYNNSCLSGAVTFLLTDASYTETAAMTINANPDASATNTLTIKPTLANTNISVTGGSATAIFILNGADYVTIDGSISATANTVCPPVSASRNLTITNSNAGTSSAVVWLQTNVADGATNNTIKNCNLVGSGVTLTLFGAGSGSNTIGTASLGTGNNNNSYVNNNISGVQYGIYSQGASTANKNTGTTINQNLINTSANTRGGIWVGFENNITISGNTVSNIAQAGSPDVFGITLGMGTAVSATTSAGNEVTNATVTKNIIGSVINSGTFSAVGIAVAAATSGTTLLANNMISGVAANGTSGDFAGGIILGGGAGSTTNLYYNTVSMQGTITGGTAASQTSACLAVTNTTPPTLDLRNNIFSNTQLGNAGATLRFVAIGLGYTSTLGNYAGLTSNNNDLYAAGAGPGTYFVGTTATIVGGTTQATLAAWTTETGRDGASVSVAPVFASTTNLHLVSGSNPTINNAGTPVSVTDDIDCVVRNVTTPDIGADEFTPSADDAGVTAIILPSPFCAGSQTVQATIRNYGTSTLTSVLVDWTVTPGGAQPQVNPSISLAPGASTTITLGNFTFASGTTYSINAITSLPNGNPDGDASNDAFTRNGVATGLTGNYNVGSGGDFLTLTAAAAAYNTRDICGPVVFTLTDATYSISETFPVIFNNNATASAINNLIIRPSGTASITGNNATSIITLNGPQYITIDGRIGSTGTTHSLTIANASTSGSTLLLINEASNNSVIYTDLKGDNTSTTNAVVFFSNTSGANGNDNNTIDNCNIGPNVANPTNGIYSSGTTTLAAQYNSGNTVSNCNIFDFFSATTDCNGILLSGGSDAWTIQNNSFYQTASRTFTTSGSIYGAVQSTSSLNNNLSISGNFIGGSAASCAGSPTTLLGNGVIRMIRLTVGTTVATSVQGNTIRNISLTSASTSTSQSAISLLTGNINCGNVTGNTIGSQSADATTSPSIDISISGSAAIFSAVLAGTGTPGALNISNNTIGGIRIANTLAPATGTSARGIGVQGAPTSLTVNNNIVGSTTTANSFTSSTTSSILGIFLATTNTGSIISNNTVANIKHTGTTATSSLIGMLLQGSTGGSFTTTGNTVRDMTNSAPNVGTGSGASVIGISHTAATTVGQTLSQNNVYNISNTDAAAATSITGIHYAGPTTGTNVVARNLVYGLTVATTSATAEIRGINFASGLANIQNNMIRLGTGVANGNIIYGLNEVAGTATSGIYFNSVYIGGTGVGTQTGNSFAFRSEVTTNTRTFQNNIFINGRSNATTGGKHYAITVAGTTPNPAGLTLNYNDYQSTGTGGFFGLFNALDVANLAAWKTAVGQDLNSLSTDPQFIDPTGVTPDLHIHPTNPTSIEGAGLAIGTVTDDYDGQVRASFTPTDIGADAGNFVAADISAPAISYTTLANTSCLTDRTLSPVTITDGSGVNITAGTRPRLYYKKLGNTNTYVDNTNATNGWKYVEATGAGGSPFSFTTDYSLLFGGVPVVTDVIQYFVVAQDLATPTINVGINNGTFAIAPTSVVLTAAAFPIGGTINSYNVVTGISGTVSVGASQTYHSLTETGAFGLFDAINTSGLSGALTVNIIDASVTETGAIALNAINYNGCAAGPYNVIIKPSTTATLTGSVGTGSVIKLNGADYVTIDGSNSGGSDRSLTIENTTTTTSGNAVVWLASPATGNGATNNTIKNCIIQGNGALTTFTGLHIGGSTAIGLTTAGLELNSNNTINNNLFRKTQYGATLFGFAAVSPDLNNVISNNNFGTAVAGEGFSLIAINADRQQGLVVSGNEIQNVTNATTAATFVGGIRLLDFKNGLCFNNKIHDLTYTGTSTPKYYGIGVTSSTYITAGNPSNAQVYNNLVYKINSTGTSAVWNMTGILASAGYGDKFYYNSVHLTGQLANSSSGLVAAFANGDGNITSVCTNIDVRDNVFSLTGSNGTAGGNFWAYTTAATTLAGSTLNNNDLYCNGTNATNNVGRFNGLSYTTLAAWQVATSQEANSIAVDPLFPSATVLQPSPGSPLVAAGTPVSVLVDITGFTRSVTTPTIGAYEQAGDFVGPVITYTTFSNTSCLTDRTLTPVTVTDGSGVNITAGTRPRLYYKKSTNANTYVDNTSGTDGWKYVEATGVGGSPFDFTTNYSLLFGGAPIAGTNIQYFVVAQDLAGTPNISINSGTFAAAPTSVALTAAAFPLTGTINSYTLGTALSSDVTIGSGGTYPTITGAGGLFEAINNGGLTANINATILSTPITENGVVALNAVGYGCAVGPYTLTIKPNTGVAAVLTGSSAAAIIKLNGADYITIDGLNTGGSSLTIENTNTGTSSGIIWLASTAGGDGATNNTIKNCTITGNASTTTLAGIGASGSIFGGVAEAANSNNTYQGNTIGKAAIGIALVGPAGLESGNVVTQNIIGSPTNLIGFRGLHIANQTSPAITSNTVQNVVTTSSTAAAGGIALLGTNTSPNVSSNTIKNISSSASSSGISSITAVYVGATSTSANVNGNIITGIVSTTTGGWGVRAVIVLGNTATISNNAISDVYNYTDASNIYWPIGIDIDGTAAGTKVYYNSVNLFGTHLGYSGNTTGGAAAALFINTSGLGLDIRDNVLSNSYDNTTSTGDKSYAIYSTATSNAQFTSINNNDYYASGATGVLGSLNATDATTLLAWQTASGQDAASIAVDPLFGAPILLQPSTGSPLLAAGTPLSVTTDLTGFTRSITTPTIGAYEQVGDFTGPIISYTVLGSTSCLTDRTLNPVTVTDGSGVNITAGTRPRLYYKKSTNANTYVDNTSGTDGWKYVEATGAGSSPFSFTTNYSLLFGGAPVAGDIIQYFVVAQDLAGSPNISINSGTFAAAPTSVALTAAAFPLTGTINSYTLAASLSADVTVGSGGTYPTLTGPGGLFQAINSGGITANINATFLNATPITEPGTVALNTISYGCAVGPYTLTIKPNPGVAAVLSGSSTSAIIKLNGADYVTIDGLNTGGSSLSITNTSATTSSAVVWIGSASASDGATNNAVKNCTISGATNITTTVGIIAGSGTTLGNAAEAANSNNTIQGNIIKTALNGIYISGLAGTYDQNWSITNNTIGSAVVAEKMSFRGMLIGSAQNFTISGNTITGVVSTATSTSTMTGIQVAFSVDGGTISNNKISDIKQINTGGWGCNGIFLGAASTASNVNVFNNVIYDVASYGFDDISQSDNGYGIMVNTGGGYNIRFNSIRMTTDQTDITGRTAAINISSGITTAASLDIRDNIFGNTQTVGNRYAIINAAANTVFSSINYNDYYPGTGVLGYDGTTTYPTLLSWQTFTAQDANSVSVDPMFTSTTNLNLLAGSPLIGAGITITGVVNDYTNSTRNNPPSIGAFEDKVVFSAKIFLQGAYAGAGLHRANTANWTTATNAGALSHPYGAAPYSYTGTETVVSGFFANTGATTDPMDWVLLELRDATTPTTVIARRAAIIREDGQIVDLDGTSPVSFRGINSGTHFVVIRHRNHLGVRSGTTQLIDGNATTPTTYDFTTAQSQALQDGAITTNAAMAVVSTGVFGLWAGNVNQDVYVRATTQTIPPPTKPSDVAAILTILGGNSNATGGYTPGDVNLDGYTRATTQTIPPPTKPSDGAIILSSPLGGNGNATRQEHKVNN